jgi:hypothetical protein
MRMKKGHLLMQLKQTVECLKVSETKWRWGKQWRMKGGCADASSAP